MTDLQIAFDSLKAKAKHHNLRWDYYGGKQPLRWTSEKLYDVFGSDQSDYVLNWCAAIVDATVNRMQLEGFQVANNEAMSTRLNDLIDMSGLLIDSDIVHKECDITGESYVIAWRGDDGEIEAYRNDSRNVHIAYAPDKPRAKRMAAKWWVDDSEHRRITLYYPDRLEYWRSVKKSEDIGDFKEADWTMEASATNPFGTIPVFHFRLGGCGESELDNALSLQDIVNKTLSDLVVAGEFESFPQRWMITKSDMPSGGMPISPKEVWKLPPNEDPDAQPVTLGQFDAADLNNFLKTIDSISQSMAAITHTPKHIFWGQGGQISGEALMALEAPLIKKVTRYLARMKQTWRELGVFLLQLEGQSPGAVTDVKAIFADPKTVQPLTQALVRSTNVGAGIPLVTLLRDEGWTDAEIEQMNSDEEAPGVRLANRLSPQPTFGPEPDTESS